MSEFTSVLCETVSVFRSEYFVAGMRFWMGHAAEKGFCEAEDTEQHLLIKASGADARVLAIVRFYVSRIFSSGQRRGDA